jgi:hypothetical protein
MYVTHVRIQRQRDRVDKTVFFFRLQPLHDAIIPKQVRKTKFMVIECHRLCRLVNNTKNMRGQTLNMMFEVDNAVILAYHQKTKLLDAIPYAESAGR